VFYLIVTVVLSINNNHYDYNERERQVIELYNQGKSTREIAKEQRLSLRDINLILKKHGANHGIALIDDDDNNVNLVLSIFLICAIYLMGLHSFNYMET
jgi:DNA invertase Pin-like site-specific DNA recombinase